ncbi:uracil nucleotide/cysteinyl leukotriene receptor [Cololabis saira]|uniref:uracil nucleotide/cysteinyl leukotriene receptor n=1 Tax=Cololabis saira TaxID=129043 RepID=UPI002AD331F0|nr:uracil nucleotide/cysteinyl leukotriene receptor [Cololabis saira]
MNISEEGTDGLHSPCWNIVFSAFYILIFIIAVPGNTLALWAFCHQKSSSSSKVFLRNLSIADISYVLILPMRIVYHLSDSHWAFGHILCQLSGFLFYLNMYCSLYLMSFISLDRFLAVVFPLRSQSVRKPLYANVAVVILWLAVIISMLPTLFSKKDDGSSSGICKKLYLENTSPTALISTIVAFSTPLTTIISCYILILLKLRKLRQQEHCSRKDKAIKVVIFIMMTFLFVFMPYHVSRIVYIQSHTHGHVSAASRGYLGIANKVTSALTCVNGILDPVLYFYLNRAYREKCLHLFCKNRQRDQ